MNRPVALSLTLVLAGCASFSAYELDQRYGPPDPARYDTPRVAAAGEASWDEVRPIVENRCVLCHGCYDSPCQLNLASYEGLTRGANKTEVYDSGRLRAADPTRLGTDAASTAAWREKDFFPVLNERRSSVPADQDGSVLYQLLALKAAEPAPAAAILDETQYDLALDRAQVCPTIEQFGDFAKEHPTWGMPYGLPALPAAEYQTLRDWVAAGAPVRAKPAPSAAHLRHVAEWERFLNGSDAKSRLVSRYLYEHWFPFHLYFDDLPPGTWFELVRSATPPGEPLSLIATRRPYDDPGVARVWYRLRPVTSAILAKTHMPYALNDARMARLRGWFFGNDYTVSQLPSYAPETSANPFVIYAQLPVAARYRFMLDDAGLTIMGFIKSPVCRGQVAVNVINDHFWVMFADPDATIAGAEAGAVTQALLDLRFPGEHESAGALVDWRIYAGRQKEYLRAKSDYVNARFTDGNGPTLKMLWDGDGKNRNATLTVFRHFDNATVVQGLLGSTPQTAWVISYPLFERIHYLLVAGFDVYGTVGHQLTTRLYMDFLRMEGEFNFLMFLPRAARPAVVDHWYRDTDEDTKAYLDGSKAQFDRETGVRYETTEPLPELYGMLKERFLAIQPTRYDLRVSGLDASALAELRKLNKVSGSAVSHLPPVTFLEVTDASGGSHPFTIIENEAYTNIAHLMKDSHRRLPEEDTLVVVNGFLGAYPSAFTRVAVGDLDDYVQAVSSLGGPADYTALLDRYGIRRTSPRFWAHSDRLHAQYRQWDPVEAGLFDYNRLENR